MKNIITILLLALGVSFTTSAQTGVNTRTPAGSSITEISSTNQGILIPRLNIPSKTNKAPVTATIVDGLLAYNIGTALSQTLFFWDAANNSWSSALYFKETPKIATFGLLADKSVLDNAVAGDYEFFTGATNPFYTINSGYMPGISFKQAAVTGRWGFAVGEGSYILEVSYLLTAPAANPTSNATVLENGYYNMGYFCDLIVYPFTASTNGPTGANVINKRVEGATISKINEQHRVRFIHTFQISGSGQSFLLALDIGRRSSSSFNDQVTVLSNGTIFKLTKLQ